MYQTRTISELQVIGIRYWETEPAENDDCCVSSYLETGIFSSIEVPFHFIEPKFPEERRLPQEVDNLAIFGGIIADAIAGAYRKNMAVMIAGGDCNTSPAVLGGLQDVLGAGARIGLIWFDAHGDFNTVKTSTTNFLGGMPVAVMCGLTHPNWRMGAHIKAPLPTDRIVLVDVRDLDPLEKALINATNAVIAAPATGFPGSDLKQAVTELANKCDVLYLHFDADVLDESYLRNYPALTVPDGPNPDQLAQAIDCVMETGKVAVFSFVSADCGGENPEPAMKAFHQILSSGLRSWKRYGNRVQV